MPVCPRRPYVRCLLVYVAVFSLRSLARSRCLCVAGVALSAHVFFALPQRVAGMRVLVRLNVCRLSECNAPSVRPSSLADRFIR